jgi:hypothetical protein
MAVAVIGAWFGQSLVVLSLLSPAGGSKGQLTMETADRLITRLACTGH